MKIKKKNLVNGKIKYHQFKGSELVTDFFENRFKGKEVLVYFDPDVDGLIAGLLACKSLANKGIKFTWYINSNREHGFKLPIEKVKGMCIFAVDFIIDADTMKELVGAGCNVLSMDHHDNGDIFIEYESNGCKGIVINNQYEFEDEDGRYLSGAGVVYESLLPYFGEDFDTQENRALVGITLLSDIRDIENINARIYLQDLYTHKYKGYIGYLIDNTLGEIDFNFGLPRMDRDYVDFTFSPIINSLLRFNKQDDVVRFFLGSGKLDKSYRDRQKKLIQEMLEKVRVIPFSNINIVVLDKAYFKGTDDEEYLSNFIGLLASQFLDGERSAICYLVDGKTVGRASFRGRVTGLDYLSDLKEVVNGVGHGPAFGIRNLAPSKKLFMRVNDICKELESTEDFSVRYVKTGNMSMMANSKGYDLGVENIFCLTQNRTYIKYTGKNVRKCRSGAKYIEYALDGVSVMCFDSELDPCKDLILPVLERGVLCFYLNRKFVE